MVGLETGTGWAKLSSSPSLDLRTELIQDGAALAVAASPDPALGPAPRPDVGLITIPGGGGGLPRPLPILVPLGPTTILPPTRPRPGAPGAEPCQPPRMGPRGPLPLGGIGPLGPLLITVPGCGGMGPPRPPPRIPGLGGIILPGIGPLPPGLGGLRRGGPALPPRGMGPLGKGRPDPHWGQQDGASRGSRPDCPAGGGARPPLGLFEEVWKRNTRLGKKKKYLIEWLLEVHPCSTRITRGRSRSAFVHKQT